MSKDKIMEVNKPTAKDRNAQLAAQRNRSRRNPYVVTVCNMTVRKDMQRERLRKKLAERKT